MERNLIVLVGSPGSGKTQFAKTFPKDERYIVSEDEQGIEGHYEYFMELIENGYDNIIIDGCNASRLKRAHYIGPAKEHGYTINMIDLTLAPLDSYRNISKREYHPIIKSNSEYSKLFALYMYYKDYQKPRTQECDYLESYAEFDPYMLDLSDDLFDSETLTYNPYLIFGDPHGCLDEVHALIKKASNDFKDGLGAVIACGDLVDRGPHISDLLITFMANENYYSVMGNHEDKLLRYLIFGSGRVKVTSGLSKTLRQIEGKIDKTALALYLMSLPLIIKVGNNYIYHAGINPEKSMFSQSRQDLLWSRGWWKELNVFKHKMHQTNFRYFGHEVNETAIVNNNTYSLDGGCVYGKELRGVLMPNRRFLTIEAARDYTEDLKQENKFFKNITPMYLWENMTHGKVNESLISCVPIPYRQSVIDMVNKLEMNYSSMLTDITNEFKNVANILKLSFVINEEEKRKLGKFISSQMGSNLKYRDAMFPVFLNQKYNIDKFIMKRIKPI